MESERSSGGIQWEGQDSRLRQLMLLRNIAIGGQTFAIAVVHEFFAAPSPLITLLSVAGLLVLFNFATTAWRLRQPRPVTDLEVFAQIVVDVGALSALLYLSGGATNPFAGMFLMPLTIAAARLPRVHALVVALLTAACYSLLISYHVPLPVPGPESREFLVVATWVNYLLCAALIAYLVLTVASRLREQDRRLAEIRRSASGHEYLMRVGSLAAGAAHEIRSPLCTMAVLVEDMLAHDDRPTLKQNLRIMSDQIEACRRTLSELVPADRGAVGNRSKEPADKFVQDIVDRFRTLRPGVKLSLGLSGPQSPAMISAERDLGRAILNLLNNAADASPEAVAMNCSWDAGELRIQVEDLGPGIPPELGESPGERLFTTKGESGTGIGLLLTRTAVQRAHGSLKLSNRPGGGARAEVVLPLGEAASEADRAEIHGPAEGSVPDPGLRADPGVAIESWRT
jgi:two-component system sensor histidine kinase RegB